MKKSVAVAVALASVLGACNTFGPKESYGPGVRIVASFYPLAEVARTIAHQADVADLTPRGGEPHDIELRPEDLVALKRADLVVYYGGGFQPAVDDAVAELAPTKVLDVSVGLPARAGDPHAWLDPTLMARIVRAIAARLAELPEADAGEVAARAGDYIADLTALDREFRAGLADCKRREIFTAHAAFGYLAARYGLEEIAITGTSPEAEPSPQRLAEVIRLARQRKATTIFFESVGLSRAATSVARAVEADGAILNPIEGRTLKEERENKTYVDVMRENLRALQEGLECKR